ncbi:hypothetical protein ID866_6305 [Astraeus odoratus]|nr:hypothetical protein ID866_6305 [Astraeus odoratus]
MTASKVPVVLNPVPGFCVKSRTTNDTVVHVDVSQGDRGTGASSSLIPVPKGLKVFVNVAWDSGVPPPPRGGEEAVQNAMLGLSMDESDPDGWFAPLVVSDARQDSDKAGQPAIVFDAIFHPSIKSRVLRDPEFKSFIIELALERIEAQTTVVLSRQIGTPNIASKGEPRSRQVLVPASLYPPGHPHHQVAPKLIQEIPTRPTSEFTPKSILRKPPSPPSTSATESPSWSWTEHGSKLRIVIDVPTLTHAAAANSTLDIEPRRIILRVPSLYDLDINLSALDAELTATFSETGSAEQALTLKRKRDLDVDNARAEWRVADKTIVLYA